MAVFDEVACLAASTEAKRFELEKHDGAEVLVDHGDINVVGRNACPVVELLAEHTTFGVFAKVFVVVGEHLVATFELYGRGRKNRNCVGTMISGTFSRRDEQSDTTIRLETTVEFPKDRFDNPS